MGVFRRARSGEIYPSGKEVTACYRVRVATVERDYGPPTTNARDPLR
jgi:hypothetical protein